MNIAYKFEKLSLSTDAKRLPFTKPTLELLEPGTPRYERAKAAFLKATEQPEAES